MIPHAWCFLGGGDTASSHHTPVLLPPRMPPYLADELGRRHWVSVAGPIAVTPSEGSRAAEPTLRPAPLCLSQGGQGCRGSKVCLSLGFGQAALSSSGLPTSPPWAAGPALTRADLIWRRHGVGGQAGFPPWKSLGSYLHCSAQPPAVGKAYWVLTARGQPSLLWASHGLHVGHRQQ